MSVKLKEIIKNINKFEKNEISDVELKDYLEKNISHRRYISLIEKSKISKKIYDKAIELYNNNSDAFTFATETYFIMDFMVLMTYGDISYTKSEFKISVYDKLCEYGIKKYILSNCMEDYKEVENIFNNMLNFMVYDIIRSFKVSDELEQIDKSVKNFKDVLVDKKGLDMIDRYLNWNSKNKK